MQCYQCHSRIPGGSVRCGYCGAPQSGPNADAPGHPISSAVGNAAGWSGGSNPFGSMDLSTAVGLLKEGTEVSASCANILGQTRRWLSRSFRGAFGCAEEIANAARLIGNAGVQLSTSRDVSAIQGIDSRTLGPAVTWATASSVIGGALADVIVLQAKAQHDVMATNQNANSIFLAWLGGLSQLVRDLTTSAEEGARRGSAVAVAFAVDATIRGCTEPFIKYADVANATGKDSAATRQAAWAMMTIGQPNYERLATLYGDRSGADLPLFQCLTNIEAAFYACNAAAEGILSVDFKYDVLALVDCVTALAALTSARANCAAFIALALRSRTLDHASEPAIDHVQRSAVIASAIAVIFLASALRQIAESFDITQAVELESRYESSWETRHAVAQLLTMA